MPAHPRRLTDSEARKINPPASSYTLTWCPASPGFGLRVTAAGARAWIAERRVDGKTVRRTLGAAAGRGAISADAARKLQFIVSGELSQGVDRLEKKRERRATEKATIQAAEFTLERLLTDYCDHLEKLKRKSYRDARSIFRLHVTEAWPKVAAMPAKDVTDEQFADMMRTLIKAGKGRTANKLRSYARAAYQMAKAAKSKPSIPASFKEYGVVLNPVADTQPDESQNKADKRPLGREDMQTYWTKIKALPGFKGALLRLHLLTGGQRIEQLVNLLTADASASEIKLFDGKGRPGHPPRPHVVPLTKEAAKALKECGPVGEYALSTDSGKTHVAATSLSSWAVEAAGIEGFQAKRLRSGVETLLAAAKISKEIRGRLQSHGVAGVQARHYDGHDYMAEKRKALAVLEKLLTAEAK